MTSAWKNMYAKMPTAPNRARISFIVVHLLSFCGFGFLSVADVITDNRRLHICVCANATSPRSERPEAYDLFARTHLLLGRSLSMSTDAGRLPIPRRARAWQVQGPGHTCSQIAREIGDEIQVTVALKRKKPVHRFGRMSRLSRARQYTRRGASCDQFAIGLFAFVSRNSNASEDTSFSSVERP